FGMPKGGNGKGPDVLSLLLFCWFFAPFGIFLYSRRYASVAPVRGGTYFSLPWQRKVGKRKPLTPPMPATIHLSP
ncbi:hypothetical protein, partial [Paraburkholderia mimosarum]|uniref:hypothetical protein n=1 Tax=Paraburkholderia mimosarum TaxID=312026 RepID=UPI001C3F1D66